MGVLSCEGREGEWAVVGAWFVEGATCFRRGWSSGEGVGDGWCCWVEDVGDQVGHDAVQDEVSHVLCEVRVVKGVGREVCWGGVVEVDVGVEEDKDSAVDVVCLLEGWGVNPPCVPGAGRVGLAEDGFPICAVVVDGGGAEGVVEAEVWLRGVWEVAVDGRCPVDGMEEGEDEEVVLEGRVVGAAGVDEALEVDFVAVHVFSITCV